jgi:hypothetical protein
MKSMTKQRRESEANGPHGQRPARVSRGGPSWTEFVRLAHQAVVAFAGTDMTNRAEPRACGHSRGSRRLDTEPETERTAGPASNAAGDGCGRAQDDQAGFQPYWGKPAVRNEQRGWRKRGQGLMATCHNARKGRHTGSHWSKPVAPPLHSTIASEALETFVNPRPRAAALWVIHSVANNLRRLNRLRFSFSHHSP